MLQGFSYPRAGPLSGASPAFSGMLPPFDHPLVAGKHCEYEMVLTNPPFGKKNSVTIVNEAGDEEKQLLVVHCDDF